MNLDNHLVVKLAKEFMYKYFKDIISVLIYAFTYFLLGHLGLYFASLNESVSPFWPASGFAIGLVLYVGVRYWPSVLIGAFFVNFLTNVPSLTAFGIAVGNTLEAVTAYYLFKHALAGRIDKKYGIDYLWIAFASGVGALLGSLVLVVTSAIPSSQIEKTFITWFTGDLLGALLIIPVVQYLHELFIGDFKNKLKTNSGILVSSIIFLASTISSFYLFKKTLYPAQIFLIFPIFLLSVRFLSHLFQHLLIFSICTSAILSISLGDGFYSAGSLNDNILHLQIFLLSFVLGANYLIQLCRENFSRLPIIVMSIGWLATTLILNFYYLGQSSKDQTHFKDLIEDQIKSIETNFEYYLEALEGGAALYAASENVSVKEWISFVNRSQITTRRPGINGIGVIWIVDEANFDSYIQRVRKEQIPDFSYKLVPNIENRPIGYEKNKYIITYIEPIEKNGQARGLDVGSEINRRQSAEMARDTGHVAISKKITLVQADKSGPGFLMYVPIYKTGIVPPTIEERQRNILGWVYAPFITANFLNGALIDNIKEINFTIFQGEDLHPDNLIYNSAGKLIPPNKFEKLTTIVLGGQEFTVGWEKTVLFVSSQDLTSSLIAFLGMLLTIYFSMLVANLESVNNRIKKLVDERTRLLRVKEGSLRKALLKANEAVKIKSSFLANMSHEIRTPLNSIVGIADLLLDSNLTSDQKKYVNLFQKAGDTLLSVVNDILDFSKLESNRIILNAEKFDFHGFLSDVVEINKINAGKKGLNLNITVGPNVPRYVVADALRLRQILMNLLGNALKFTDKGSISIVVSQKVANDGTEFLYFSVSDTGIGLNKQQLKNLFRPFVQSDSSVTKRFGGTGLGLAISKQLVELMGGEIWVNGETGFGSVFTFKVVLQSIKETEVDAKQSESNVLIMDFKNYNKLRILLVDDSEDNRLLIKAFLKGTEHEIVEAENGEEAFNKFQGQFFDLVLMDIQMPVMDGYTSTKLIRKWEAENGRQRTLIIALTAYAQQEDKQKCIDSGCDLHLAKPVKKTALLDALQNVKKAS